MGDKLLLRFRDLTADIKTIEAHNGVVEKFGSVLWGWWKKPAEASPDPGLTTFATDLVGGQEAVYFVDSSNGEIYTAPLLAVSYEPGGRHRKAPHPELCPEYYRTKELPAWFQVGQIKQVGRANLVLASYVWSKSNRIAPMRSISALPSEAIGQSCLDLEFLDSNVSLWFLTPIDEFGVPRVGEVAPAKSRAIRPAAGQYILHLSDPHFGVNHAYRNHLAVSGAPKIAKESLVEGLLDDLRHLGLKQDDIASLVVTGDLTWRGDVHEFENAAQALSTLGNRLGLHRSQVVVVPGNHDIEWRHEHGEVDGNAELNYRDFSAKLYGVPAVESLLRISRLRLAHRLVTLVGLNSCRLESKANAGLGFVGRQQLAEVADYFRSFPKETGELRVALLHHHLVGVNFLEDIDWETKRVSVTLDAEAILRTLIALQFDLVLHGHQHQPFVAKEWRVVPEYVHPTTNTVAQLEGAVALVGGGSVGVSRPHLNTIGRNAYNLIHIRPTGEVEVRIRVRSSAGPGFVDYLRKVVSNPPATTIP